MAKTKKTKSKKNKTRRNKLGGMYGFFRPQAEAAAQAEEVANSLRRRIRGPQTPSTRPFNFSGMTGIPVGPEPIPGPFSFGSMMNKTNRPFNFSNFRGNRRFVRPPLDVRYGQVAAAAGPRLLPEGFPNNYQPPDGRIPTYVSNFFPDNPTKLGEGSTKYVWGIPTDPGWAYMDSTNAQMHRRRITKQDMINDFEFARRLHGIDASFFPGVVPQWNTARRFIYKKELCERIPSDNLTFATLAQIIQRAISLMDQLLLFTLDLKPDNVGFLTRTIDGIPTRVVGFLDFGQENSFKLKDDAREDIKSLYVSFSILILLIYCYNYSHDIEIKQLQDLAQSAIPGVRVPNIRAFLQFYPEVAGDNIQGGYYIGNDTNIEIEFNLPLKSLDVVPPHLFLITYGREHWRGIVRYLLGHLNGWDPLSPFEPRDPSDPSKPLPPPRRPRT